MTGAAEPGGLGAPRADSCHSPGHHQPVKQSIPHLADALAGTYGPRVGSGEITGRVPNAFPQSV
jgi:hypothetical protein